MERVPDSTESTAAFPRGEEGLMPNTSGQPEDVSSFGEVTSPDYGPTPSVTTLSSFSPSTSSNVHPFKLERFEDNKGNTRTRIYLGRLRYLINNFNVVIQADTTGETSYGTIPTSGATKTSNETGSTFTVSGLTLPQHQHDVTNGEVFIPEHKHVARDSSEDGLLMPNHRHLAGTGSNNLQAVPATTPSSVNTGGTGEHTHSGSTGGPVTGSGGSYGDSHTHSYTISGGNHNHTYVKDNHSHIVEGETTDVKGYTSVKKVTGVTGGVKDYTTEEDNKKVTGTTGNVRNGSSAVLPPISASGSSSGIGHTHDLPALVNSPTAADRFVCVKNQDQGAGFINEIEPTGFTALKDSNDKDTVVKAKTMSIAETHGSFFLKWSITLPTGSASGATIAADAISIHRDADPTKTAEQLQNDFGKMSSLTANSETAAMASFKRDTHSEDDRTATYYVKLGVSYDPSAAGVNSKTIEQITYENVYWSPLFISSIP